MNQEQTNHETPTDQALSLGDRENWLMNHNPMKIGDEMIIENIAAIFLHVSSKRLLPFFINSFMLFPLHVKVMYRNSSGFCSGSDHLWRITKPSHIFSA